MISDIFNISLIAATIRTTTPILLVGLGGAFTTKSGIFNISLEGQMLMGAFFAVVGSYYSGSALIGVILAILISLMLSIVFVLFVVNFKANEIVVGLAINTFASGITISLMKTLFGTRGSVVSDKIVGLPSIFGFTPFVYLSIIFLILVSLFMYKTRLGLYIRVVGEKHEAATAQGINIVFIKYLSSILCGIFAGISGAHLSIGYLTLFTENMSSGRGFMAVAALIFSNGDPLKLFAGCLIFGFSDAISLRMQGFGIPSYIVLMFPYIVTLIFLFINTYNKRKKHFFETEETIKKYI